MPQSLTIHVGLISDTHRPQRLATLSNHVATAFEGVDLILHAGDVGELWVLDELSQIAPVIAVHGNDDSADSQRELPYQQLLTLSGLRLLLWHSHFPNRAEELASRKGDDMFEKLARSVAAGQRANAKLVVFGHWHIPLVYEKEGITVVNPGALASGGFITKQANPTVARLAIEPNGRFQIQHIALSNPTKPFILPTQLQEGFKANAVRYEHLIVTPEIADAWPKLWQIIRAEEYEPLVTLWLRLAHRCWADDSLLITPTMLLAELEKDETVSDGVKTAVYKQFRTQS